MVCNAYVLQLIRFVTATLCAATFSNSYILWREHCVMLRFVAVPFTSDKPYQTNIFKKFYWRIIISVYHNMEKAQIKESDTEKKEKERIILYTSII